MPTFEVCYSWLMKHTAYVTIDAETAEKALEKFDQLLEHSEVDFEADDIEFVGMDMACAQRDDGVYVETVW